MVKRSPGKVAFLLANPKGFAADEHPFAGALAEDLFESNIRVVAFVAP